MPTPWALGLRDAKLQAEAWVEGIDRTYNLILRNLAKEFMAGRQVQPWMLRIGPEGPQPGPDGN